jgi:hypothetical protein
VVGRRKEERTFDEGPMAGASKESESICMADKVDKVDKGKSGNRGGGATTGGPPTAVTTGTGGALDNSPEP